MKLAKLRLIREENNMTQREVADKLDVVLGTYAMNETGHDTITLVNLVKFCDLFNVSVDYVLDLNAKDCYENTTNYFNKDILKVRLKEMRKANNYTQERIGKLLNIDHSVWCRYEQGKTVISTMFLYSFCHELNISADYLLGRIDYMPELKKQI